MRSYHHDEDPCHPTVFPKSRNCAITMSGSWAAFSVELCELCSELFVRCGRSWIRCDNVVTWINAGVTVKQRIGWVLNSIPKHATHMYHSW